MRITPTGKNNPSFKGFMNNKAVLRGLETISEHGTTFAAGVSLVSALTLRPLAISLAPDVKKENKEYASANSICSGLVKFMMVEAIALPIENAVKKIDKEPLNYLKQATVENLKGSAETLSKSRDYKFVTQLMKQSAGLITAIPKSMLTLALIPLIMDKILKIKNKKEPISNKTLEFDPIFNPVINQTSFKGLTDKTAKGIGKILDTGAVQDFAKKHSINDTNIARNVAVATDVLLTASFAHNTKKSEKIKEEAKNPLIYNNLISTGASILFGCALDKLVQKTGCGLIEKFSNINKNDPKLAKYIEGINILRPTLIFAGIYYGVLPFVSTFLADKIDKKIDNKGNIQK